MATSFKMSMTALVTTAVIIILGIYDLVCVVRGLDSSVSAFLVNVGFKSPMVVFAFGFVAGHLFGYLRPIECDK